MQYFSVFTGISFPLPDFLAIKKYYTWIFSEITPFSGLRPCRKRDTEIPLKSSGISEKTEQKPGILPAHCWPSRCLGGIEFPTSLLFIWLFDHIKQLNSLYFPVIPVNRRHCSQFIKITLFFTFSRLRFGYFIPKNHAFEDFAN